jgi:hypothetical protein
LGAENSFYYHPAFGHLLGANVFASIINHPLHHQGEMKSQLIGATFVLVQTFDLENLQLNTATMSSMSLIRHSQDSPACLL